MYTIDQLVNAGFYGYAGWDRESANQDYQATGGSGKGSLTNPAALGGITSTGADFTGTNQFNFDWNQAEQDALNKLKPYYEQVLAEANYDINRAKQILEEDYQRGARYNAEDLATGMQNYSALEPREQNTLLTGLNKRGVLQSTIRNTEQQYLTDTQQQRREALQRAIDRKNELAGVERQRGISDVETKGTRYKRDVGEEEKQRALDLSNMQYNRDYSRFLAEANRFVT
jgi:hypothetical protein